MPDEAALDELLSQPTAAVVDAMARLEGDVLILGAGGKMGPGLARLAVRASAAAQVRRRVVAVARFPEGGLRWTLERDGVETWECDLFDHQRLATLPDAPNVIYLVGQKFGTTGAESTTWAVNTHLPAVASERFRQSRIVAFSTGNVYPLWPADSEGPGEQDPTGPIGEYAQSALGRERVLAFFSSKQGTPMVILRLNYAVEPRYGVLRDIADQVRASQPIDLRMGRVNVIWQRDANAIALRSLAHCNVPPMVLNVTGRPAVSVRGLAQEFGRRFGVEPQFDGAEAATALLSNAARCEELFGAPETGLDEMIERVAEWVRQGGRSLAKPTHFEMREGRF